jgi:hypothetical protein
MTDPTWAFSYKITTYWTVEYQLHTDNTVTILAHYRDGRNACPELKTQFHYNFTEVAHLDTRRVAVDLQLYAPGRMVHERGELVSTHPIRNPAHVFSYPDTPTVKVGGIPESPKSPTRRSIVKAGEE